jgi:hydroxymethylbilane synthase
MLPAPGQGALAVQTRAADTALADVVTTIVDASTETATLAERAFLGRLGAGCRLPVAAYAEVDGQGKRVTLRAMLALTDGTTIERIEGHTVADEAASLGGRLADELLARVGNA